MSYYIGATGEYIWEELLDNTTSNVIISNHINLDATPLTDILQDIITDAAGTALSELIAPITEVPSATGVGVVALTALGLLSYYKLNRTAVQDVDSMVYSADYASILTPGMFDDRVRIRYDTNQFSNVFYNVDNVKKGEILTSRINLLPAGVNDVDLYTSTGRVGIGTTPETQLHIYKGGNQATNIIRLETPVGGSSSIEFKRGTEYDAYADFRLIGYNGLFKLQYENNELAYGDTGTDIISASKTQITINKHTTFIENVGIGTYPATQLHIYNATSPTINIQSIADGTPIVEFMRGTSSDVNKDYRFISQSDIFKLQFQDATTYYMDANNQLISINATDTIIHKQTEFKANVLIGGDTRTIGYVGVGTTASTALHVYTAAANILRLQTAPVNGTNSIEFMRGNSTDPLTDYRIFTDTGGKFKIQYANNLLAYGDAETDLIELSTTNTIIYKPTEIKGNVGIGTTPHATYKVDVNGTINATAFRGDGANITALNEANLILTTTKLYNNFNQTNFAIIDNKIDITPNYSINITDYDSQTLFGLSVERKYKGKMTANYDDRNGVYKLITTNNRTDNVAVLNYKVGDKISIRNTATVANDYLLESGSRYYNSLLLIKRPNNIPLNWAVNDAHNVLLYEWFSSDGLEGRPEARVRTPTNRYFPFTTVMTFLIESGFNYYLCKLYNTVEVSGGSLIVVASGYGDDYNDFNRAFGAGQTFKLQITGSTFADDYLPTEYIGADIGIASDRRLGGVKKGRGVAIDETTGALDATPVSVDLINSMNTSHFTNNTGTNKIDISSTYVAPSATKLATARNIAGVSFDGSGAIDIPYGNLSSIPSTWGESQIPSLPISKITNLQAALDGKAPTSHTHSIANITNLQTTLDGKAPTSHTHAIADITNLQTTLDGKAPTSHTHSIANITNLQTTLDGKASTTHTHAIADITNLQTTLDGKAPTSHTHVIGDITNLQTTLDGKAPTSHSHTIANITNLQTTLDGKQATLTAGTGITILGTTISSTSTFTPTSANLISIFNSTQFVNNVGTSKIDIDVNWKPTTCSIADAAMKLVSSRNIAGVAFDGTTSIAIPFANIGGLTAELATKQATINSTAGQLIIGNGNGATTTSTSLTWTEANSLLTVNGFINANFDITLPTATTTAFKFGSTGTTLFGRTMMAGLYSTSAVVGDAVLKTLGNLHLQSGNGASAITIATTTNNVGIGKTNPNASYMLDVAGDVNITGTYRVNGTPFSGSKWTTLAVNNIYFDTGNVGIGTFANPTDRLIVYDETNVNNTTALTIQNNKIIAGGTIQQAPTPTFSIGGPSTSGNITGSIDKYMIFTATTVPHTFTVPPNFNCDILMIGGGGSGGAAYSGGGAGACIVALNQTLNTGTCLVLVGIGQVPLNDNSTGTGEQSVISVNGTARYVAKGGGRGGGGSTSAGIPAGTDGGCGGGAKYVIGSVSLGGNPLNTNIVNGIATGPVITSTYAVLGNKGGDDNDTNNTTEAACGGGGIGTAGVNHAVGDVNGTVGGAGLNQVVIGGTTYNFQSYFANGGAFGADGGYIGGGGGGMTWISGTNPNANLGGIGGGGRGFYSPTSITTTAGLANTGSGGGGRSSVGNVGGGSGIVIIRYRTLIATTTGSPVLQLIRGEPSDTFTDYKIGNYNGDFKIMSSVSGADTNNVVIADGNVGIGLQPTGSYKLDVNGTLNATSVLVNGTAVSGSKWTSSGSDIYYNSGRVGISTNALTSTFIFQVGAGGKLSIANSGVDITTIGTTATNDSNNTRINLYGVTHPTAAGLIQYVATSTTGLHRFFTTTAGSSTEKMRLTTLGRLGIGSIAPNFLVEVGTGTGSTGSISQRYFNSVTALTLTTITFADVSMKVNGTIWTTATITASSDSRIKEDIQDINDDSALQSILAIEPKTYKYVDKIAKGDKKVYGFIAQQIREVIPEATTIQTSYIPNIMLLADYIDGLITLPSQPTKVIIKVNDKIKCYDKYDKEVNVEVVEVIDELTFRIKALETSYDDNKIFVSGTEIDDFHTLDKSYIYTLNVCATQELHRRIKSQEERIKELELKMVDILKYLSL